MIRSTPRSARLAIVDAITLGGAAPLDEMRDRFTVLDALNTATGTDRADWLDRLAAFHTRPPRTATSRPMAGMRRGATSRSTGYQDRAGDGGLSLWRAAHHPTASAGAGRPICRRGPRSYFSFCRRASSSWSSRMMIRQAASRAVP